MGMKTNIPYLHQIHNLVKQMEYLLMIILISLQLDLKTVKSKCLSKWCHEQAQAQGSHTKGHHQLVRDVLGITLRLLGHHVGNLSPDTSDFQLRSNSGFMPFQVRSVIILMTLRLTTESQPRSNYSMLLLPSQMFSIPELCSKMAETDSSKAILTSQDPETNDLFQLDICNNFLRQDASEHMYCTIKNKIGLDMQTFANDSLFIATSCLEEKKIFHDKCLPPGWRCASRKDSLPTVWENQNQGLGSLNGPSLPTCNEL